MVNFLLKLILFPGALFLADAFSPVLNYSNYWQIIYTGLFIGVVAFMLDMLLLKRIGAGTSALVDLIAAALVVYFSQYFLAYVYITMVGSLLAGALIGIGEYLVHRLIVTGDREATDGVRK